MFCLLLVFMHATTTIPAVVKKLANHVVRNIFIVLD